MIRLIAVLARVSERLYSLVAEAPTGHHFELPFHISLISKESNSNFSTGKDLSLIHI